jgi:hypothetical protein
VKHRKRVRSLAAGGKSTPFSCGIVAMFMSRISTLLNENVFEFTRSRSLMAMMVWRLADGTIFSNLAMKNSVLSFQSPRADYNLVTNELYTDFLIFTISVMGGRREICL